jgi:hypothetical protein
MIDKELDQTFYEIQVKGYLDARWTGKSATKKHKKHK